MRTTTTKRITNDQASPPLLQRLKERKKVLMSESNQPLRTVCFRVTWSNLYQLVVQPGVGCDVLDVVMTIERNPSSLMDTNVLMWCSIAMTFVQITCQSWQEGSSKWRDGKSKCQLCVCKTLSCALVHLPLSCVSFDCSLQSADRFVKRHRSSSTRRASSALLIMAWPSRTPKPSMPIIH